MAGRSLVAPVASIVNPFAHLVAAEFTRYDAPIDILESSRVSKDYFQRGDIQFCNRVLRFDLESISEPVADLCELPLQRDCTDERVFRTAAHQYYRDFENHIFEEVRANIDLGLRQFKNHELGAAERRGLKNFKLARNRGNPSTLTFAGGLRRAADVGYSQLALLLISPDDERFLGLGDLNWNNTQLKVKVILPGGRRLQAKQNWRVVLLGSVVSEMRMFSACYEKFGARRSYMRSIISGNPDHFVASGAAAASAVAGEVNYAESHASLNELQREAVERFMQFGEGVQFLHGPPGTGKSRVITSLLETCVANANEKTLVCAPSNKAIQVLVERFAANNPEVPFLLVGVEKNIPEYLRDCTLDCMLENWLQKLYASQEVLNSLDNNKLLERSTTIDVLQSELQKFAGYIEAVFLATQKYRVSSLFFSGIFSELHACCEACMQAFIGIDDEMKGEYWRCLEEGESLPDHIVSALENLRMVRQNLDTAAKRLIDNFKQYRSWEMRQTLQDSLVRPAPIVFATLISAGRDIFREVAFHNLIVDEAAQACEAAILVPFVTWPTKCLLVGDHMQLPATVISPRAQACGFSKSLMQRMVVDNAVPCLMLQMQYRMHPEIRLWPSERFYGSGLCDADVIATREDSLEPLPSLGSCKFFDVQTSERRVGTSFCNIGERDFALLLAENLKTQLGLEDYSSIGIITFYSGQVGELRAEARRRDLSGLSINSVDGFQGDERDYIIVSFVRSNRRVTVGFLNDFRRLNVAVTRAKFGLFMFGTSVQ